MTCPIKHALDECQLALGRVQQRQPQAGYTFTAAHQAISAARAELARLQAAAVPEGWQLVPVNPPDEQLVHLLTPEEKALVEEQLLPRSEVLPLAIQIAGLRDLYAAMLSAAPKP